MLSLSEFSSPDEETAGYALFPAVLAAKLYKYNFASALLVHQTPGLFLGKEAFHTTELHPLVGIDGQLT